MISQSAQPVLRRILLATDLSVRCDRALDRAAIIASEWPARLAVVHAYEPDIYALTQELRPVPSWRQEPNLKLAVADRQLRQDLGGLDVPFDLVMEEGAPADVILRTAGDRGADLIVTGVARHEPFGRLIFGSTVDQLIRNARVPVLVVKSRAREPYRDIVVATDFSPESAKAVRMAMALFPHAGITLLHCYEPRLHPMANAADAADMALSFAENGYKEFVEGNSEAAADFARLPIFIERGSMDSVLQAYAADKPLDLVVFGSQGKNALVRTLVGSTAEASMVTAPTDVLVVTSASRIS